MGYCLFSYKWTLVFSLDLSRWFKRKKKERVQGINHYVASICVDVLKLCTRKTPQRILTVLGWKKLFAS